LKNINRMDVGKWLRGWKVNRMVAEFCNLMAINFRVVFPGG